MFEIKAKFSKCLITISFPFLILFTAFLLLNDNLAIVWGILGAVVHELGHLFAMYLKKCLPSQIHVQAFSVDIIATNNTQRDYKTDVLILLAGPLANLGLSLLLFLLYKCSKALFLVEFTYANLFLAIFNMLPIEALDGGQLVFYLLIRKIKIKTAEKLSIFISFFSVLPLAVLGFYTLLQSKYNFSLFFLSCYLIATLLFKTKNIFINEKFSLSKN